MPPERAARLGGKAFTILILAARNERRGCFGSPTGDADGTNSQIKYGAPRTSGGQNRENGAVTLVAEAKRPKGGRVDSSLLGLSGRWVRDLAATATIVALLCMNVGASASGASLRTKVIHPLAGKAVRPTKCAVAASHSDSRRIGGIVRPIGARRTAKAGCVGAHDSTAPLSAGDPVAPGTDPPLSYNGGSVMGTGSSLGSVGEVTVTPIYWAPGGYSFANAYETLQNQFITDVAFDSGKPTNVFAVDQEYSNGAHVHLSYKLHAGSPITDSQAYPTSGGCTPDSGTIYSGAAPTTYSACLTTAQIANEVKRLVTNQSLPNDLGHLYVLFTPKGVESCFDTPNGAHGGSCTINNSSSGAFCAYHSSFGTSSPPIFADLPFPIYGTGGPTCSSEDNGFSGGTQSPNANADGDVETSPLSHEMNEAFTDPYIDAWYDNSGNEIGDECAYVYGSSSTFGGSGGAFYNQTINNHHYFIQEEFSNEDYVAGNSGCIQQEVLPTASFATVSQSPTAGSAVNFSGSASAVTDAGPPATIAAYSWNFGDQSTGSGVTPSHTYSSPGTYTVTLAVTDSDNWTSSTSASQQVVIGSGVAGPPSGLSASGGTRSVALSWTAPASNGGSPITGYNLYQGSGSGSETSSAVNGTTLISGTSFTVNGLSDSTTYFFVARAVNGNGLSALSNEASATTTTPVVPSVAASNSTQSSAPSTSANPSAPNPPQAPTGSTASASGSSNSSSGTAVGNLAGTSATASGFGSLLVAQYGSDPVSPPTFSSAGQFFDVKVASGSSFSTLTISNCNLGSGNAFDWFNPAAAGGAGAWEAVQGDPGPTLVPGPPACLSVTLDGASNPNVSQLSGTVFAVAIASPLAAQTNPAAIAAVVHQPRITLVGSHLVVAGIRVPATVRCTVAPCRGQLSLTKSITVTVKQGKRTVKKHRTIVLANGSFKVGEGKRATVNLVLTAGGRSAFANVTKSPVRVSLSSAVTGGRSQTSSVLVS